MKNNYLGKTLSFINNFSFLHFVIAGIAEMNNEDERKFQIEIIL
jgi:hypothetical protein